MKKLLFLFVLLAAGVQAQIVNIPDPVFKAKLIQLGYDTSGDGEISQSEADLVWNLNLNNTAITNLEGIGSFHNLYSLSVKNTGLSSLVLSGFNTLTSIDASNIPTLTAVSLSSLPLLNDILLDHTSLTSFEITATPWLTQLYASNVTSPGFTIDLTNAGLVSNIPMLILSHSSITSLDVSGTTVEQIEASYSALQTLLASNTPHLLDVDCSYAALVTADFSNSGVTKIFVDNNPNLQELLVSGSSELQWLWAQHGALTELDLSGCESLQDLEFYQIL